MFKVVKSITFSLLQQAQYKGFFVQHQTYLRFKFVLSQGHSFLTPLIAGLL